MTLLILAVAGCATPDPTPDPAARPAEQATEPATVSAVHSLDDGFDPLSAALEGKRLVMLGEASHGDGATFETKVKLVEWLHEEHGFDVLVFESDIFGCEWMNSALKNGTRGSVAAQRCITPIWLKSAQVSPLWEYLSTTRRTSSPLEVGGLDSKLTSKATKERLIGALENDEASEQYRAAFEGAKPEIAALLDNPMKYEFDAEGEAALLALRDVTKDTRMQVIVDSLLAHAKSMATLKRLIAEHGAELESKVNVGELNNVRDAQMAANLRFLMRERFPNRRVIVWAANAHIARGLSDVDLSGRESQYDGYLSMGEHLHNELGDQMYAIGFSAAGGEYGLPWGKPAEIGSVDGSVETVAEAGEVTFIDLARDSGEFSKPMVAIPFGYHPATADWTEVFDGLIVHATMTPSTMAQIEASGTAE